MSGRLPRWLVKRGVDMKELHGVKKILREKGLSTVCEEARCPNIGECFKRPTATFMIMGDVCSRQCSFCSVNKGIPSLLDADEPAKVAMAVAELELKYVVITSVTRDDLADGGAEHFAKTVLEIRKLRPETKVEILIPDFKGSREAIKTVCDAKPYVINHNIETVPRLYSSVRPQADYKISLSVIKMIREFSDEIITKSGIMVGFGEEYAEVVEVMKDLREAGCEMLTIGQYLTPTKESIPVSEFIHPEVFRMYEAEGKKLGFRSVASGPFVRSSYMADEQFGKES